MVGGWEELDVDVVQNKLAAVPQRTAKESLARWLVERANTCRSLAAFYLDRMKNSGKSAGRVASRNVSELEEKSGVLFSQEIRDIVASGSLERLRSALLDDAVCDRWIPAPARDSDGPTVHQLVGSAA